MTLRDRMATFRSDDDGTSTGAYGALPPRLGFWLAVSPLLGCIALFLFSLTGGFAAGATFVSVLGVGLMVGSASTLVGAIIGFLFGLPRTIERSDMPTLMASNTNLEQISDWLTKILVALGLVQLGKLADGLRSLADSLAPGFGGRPESPTFALALLIYGLADGFLVGYLWTRLVVSVRLKHNAEVLAVSELLLARPLPPSPPTRLPPPPPPTTPNADEDTGLPPVAEPTQHG